VGCSCFDILEELKIVFIYLFIYSMLKWDEMN
jgi:hypothetical protein